MRIYPAIDVHHPSSTDALLALLDDLCPTAIEEHADRWRVFFSSEDARGGALQALNAAHYSAAAVDVDDEDWARRSQEGLGPVTVGRITVAPPWATAGLKSCTTTDQPPDPSLQPLLVVIEPSMGFGTGHHATTRLCLAALQAVEIAGRVVLDVGTGSGVLAIAADGLGARQAIGIDNDPDAVQSAARNLAFNPRARHVKFHVADLASADLPQADVVVANLTGALLARAAPQLVRALRPQGTLIVSGLLAGERQAVDAALAPATACWEGCEDEWIGLALRFPAKKKF